VVEAHTKLQIVTDLGDLEEELLPIGAAVEHVKGHLMMVTTLEGARVTWNFRHVVKYQLTEMPATPAEGS